MKLEYLRTSGQQAGEERGFAREEGDQEVGSQTLEKRGETPLMETASPYVSRNLSERTQVVVIRVVDIQVYESDASMEVEVGCPPLLIRCDYRNIPSFDPAQIGGLKREHSLHTTRRAERMGTVNNFHLETNLTVGRYRLWE